MATVPTVEGPSVNLTPAPNAYQETPRALGEAGAAVAQQFGMAQQVANSFADRYRKEQELADQVRVDDAINQAKEKQIDLTFNKDTGYINIKGIAALQRDSGKPLAEEYAEQYKNSLNDITSSLGNDRQKRAFQLRANDMLSGFRGQVLEHEGKEFHNYTISTYDGTIANRKQEVGLYFNDPTKIDEALGSIEAAATAKGRMLGLSASQIEANARKESSNALVVGVSAALEKNDVMYADALIKRYSSKMDADDLLRIRGATDKQMDSAVATKVATDAVRSVSPRVQPTDFDRIANITMSAESGGRRYGSDGQLLTSSAGAKGEMQVMDGTNLDPGFGVKPADMSGTPEQQASERARVGRDYLAAMIKKYGGNVARAWAAYNAGPGAVDKALDEAAKDAGSYRTGAPPDSWLMKLPKETQEYVAKNVAAFQQGEGKPSIPTLQEVHDNVRAQLAGTMNPSRVKLAMDEATRQWDDLQKSVKQQGESATAAAQQWLASNGGRFSLMPNSIRQSVLQYAPKEMDNLISYGQKISKGEDRTEPEWYQQFSNHDYLRSLNDTQYFNLSSRYLSQEDKKHFDAERGKLLTGAGSDKPNDLNTGAIKSVLDNRLRELNIDPTPKDDGTADAARIGAIRQYVDRSIIQAQVAAGKKFSDAEINKHIDGLFAQTDKVSTWLGLGSNSQSMLTIQTSDIPSSITDKLKADFKRLGVDSPTDAQILGAYFQAKSAAKRTIKPLSSMTKQ